MRRLLLGLAVAATTLVPSVVSANDTQIADFIQTRLQSEQQQGRLKGFNVDMQVEKGTVWFRGTVSNASQEKLILKTAQQAGHLGVVQVVDDIEVASAPAAPVRPVAYTRPQPQMSVPPIQEAYTTGQAFSPAMSEPVTISPPTPPVASQQMGTPIYSEPMNMGGMVQNEPMPFASCGGAPIQGGYAGPSYGGQGAGEPLPQATAGPGVPSGAPNLPGYAWPGYAASPNYGAVSYPKQYSASAWPYIGPFYPYPQVPLGWRKVSLEWDDGFWQLDFSDKSRN